MRALLPLLPLVCACDAAGRKVGFSAVQVACIPDGEATFDFVAWTTGNIDSVSIEVIVDSKLVTSSALEKQSNRRWEAQLDSETVGTDCDAYGNYTFSFVATGTNGDVATLSDGSGAYVNGSKDTGEPKK